MTKRVIVNSFRGGTGKTTIVSNLATHLAKLGMKVLIVDGDMLSPGVHAIFGLESSMFSATYTDLVLGSADIDDAVYDLSESLDLEEGSLLLCPSSLNTTDIAQVLSSTKVYKKMYDLIKKLESRFSPDYVIVDTHPGINKELLESMGENTTYLNVIRPDNQDYQGSVVLTEINKKMKTKSAIIINRVHPSANAAQLTKKVQKLFKTPVIGTLPFSEDILFSESQYLFSIKHPHHAFSKMIQRISYEVFGVQAKEDIEISYELLKLVKKEKKPADLLSKSALSKAHFTKKVDDLLENDFLHFDGDVFAITKKGMQFLQKYATIKTFVHDFRL